MTNVVLYPNNVWFSVYVFAEADIGMGGGSNKILVGPAC